MTTKGDRNLFKNFSPKFSNRLLTVLLANAEDDRNISVSPSRLQAVLALLANWANPTIQRMILDTIGSEAVEMSDANVLCNKENMKIVPWDERWTDSYPTIEIKTFFWYMHHLVVNSQAVERVSKYYDVIPRPIDFTQSEAKNFIDKVIDESTHGLIQEGGITPQPYTKALITDILYFKAMWNNPFSDYSTREQLFYGTRGKTMVPIMQRECFTDYIETEKCQIAKLLYESACEGKTFAMRIYLPKKGYTTLDVLEEVKYSEFFLDWSRKLVRLYLPKFSVESDINMQRTLEHLGLECIFESEDIIPACIKDMQITQISQKVKVNVDEHGTEAAALTEVGMVMGGLPEEMPEPIMMKVNRPFIFEITEELSNTILFTGVINNI